MRNVVYHVADNYQSQQKRDFQRDYLLFKGSVVDSHAALNHTDDVELNHAKRKSERLAITSSTAFLCKIFLFLLGDVISSVKRLVDPRLFRVICVVLDSSSLLLFLNFVFNLVDIKFKFIKVLFALQTMPSQWRQYRRTKDLGSLCKLIRGDPINRSLRDGCAPQIEAANPLLV